MSTGVSTTSSARRAGVFPLHLGLGEEWVPPNEAGAIEQMLALHRDVQEQVDRREHPVPRGQHPKQHGTVFAVVTVAPDIPGDLRHGIFAEPQAWPAIIRFSNARMRHDQLPDAHGMAIKLLDVVGPRLIDDGAGAATQDLVLVDHPVFFMSNVAEGVTLLRAFHSLTTGGLVARARTALRGLVSQERAFRIMRAMATKRPVSPLVSRYWSTTPIRVGHVAVKISVAPYTTPDEIPRMVGRDRLRRALAEQLRAGEARFDLLLQRQSHPVTTPVEDPTVEWEERKSPPIRVAEIRIPAQRFEAPAQLAFGENLSFTPWHGLQAHRSLGGINRARRVIYEVMAARRRSLNQAPLREPAAAEVRALWQGQLL